jgi:hypothetical protein
MGQLDELYCFTCREWVALSYSGYWACGHSSDVLLEHVFCAECGWQGFGNDEWSCGGCGSDNTYGCMWVFRHEQAAYGLDLGAVVVGVGFTMQECSETDRAEA